MTEPQDATWWAEVEESLGHLDVAEQCRAGGVALFGPVGQDSAAALHPAGRDSRPVTGNPLSEIRRQLNRIENEQTRTLTALRWIFAIVIVYALATRR